VRQPQPAPPVVREAPEPARPQPARPQPATPAPAARQPQQQDSTQPGGRPLPGEPANRVFPGRSEIGPRQTPAVSRQAATPAPQRGGFSPEHRNERAQKPSKPAPAVQHKGGDERDASRGPRR